jgi:hypothetical protein
MIGNHSQTAAPPTLSNGAEKTVKTAAVIDTIAKPSANDVKLPIVRRNVCRYPKACRSLMSLSTWSRPCFFAATSCACTSTPLVAVHRRCAPVRVLNSSPQLPPARVERASP